MNKINLTCLLFFLLAFYLSACKTYYIPVDSFKQQFAGLYPSREVTTSGPAGDKVKYMTYPIDTIRCIDNKGKPYSLPTSPSLETRFTYNGNKRVIFYFDLIRINDTGLTGGRSRFISSIKKTIPLNAIKKIEIQDGRKNYRYVR